MEEGVSNIPLGRQLLLKLADELGDDVYSVRIRNIVETFMVRRRPRKVRKDVQHDAE